MTTKSKELFVVYYCENLRDGIDEGAKIVPSVAEGVKLIESLANGFGGSNMHFKLFRIGSEIRLNASVVESPQPTVKRAKFQAVK